MIPSKQAECGESPPCGRPNLPRTACPGFSLVELLTVIAIIAILSAIITPVVRNAIRNGRTAANSSNLRAIALANQMYAADNNGESVMAFSAAETGLSLLWYQELRPYMGLVKERNGEVEVFISPCDPNEGGRLGGFTMQDWQRRSYSVNYNIRTYFSGQIYRRVPMSGMDSAKMIFACDHRAIEIGTQGVMPSSQASLDMIPLDWHNEYGSAQFVYIDGHVEMIPVADVMPKAEGADQGRYKEWSAFY